MRLNASIDGVSMCLRQPKGPYKGTSSIQCHLDDSAAPNIITMMSALAAKVCGLQSSVPATESCFRSVIWLLQLPSQVVAIHA